MTYEWLCTYSKWEKEFKKGKVYITTDDQPYLIDEDGDRRLHPTQYTTGFNFKRIQKQIRIGGE